MEHPMMPMRGTASLLLSCYLQNKRLTIVPPFAPIKAVQTSSNGQSSRRENGEPPKEPLSGKRLLTPGLSHFCQAMNCDEAAFLGNIASRSYEKKLLQLCNTQTY